MRVTWRDFLTKMSCRNNMCLAIHIPFTRQFSIYPPAFEIRALSAAKYKTGISWYIYRYWPPFVGLWSKLRAFTSPFTDNTDRESPAFACDVWGKEDRGRSTDLRHISCYRLSPAQQWQCIPMIPLSDHLSKVNLSKMSDSRKDILARRSSSVPRNAFLSAISQFCSL